MTASYTAASIIPTTIPVASTRVYLGTTTTTADNDTFVEIGGVLSIPTFGPSDTDVKIQTVGNNLEVTEKGVVSPGGGELECVRDVSDTGQTNLIAAEAVLTGNYNLRIVFPNKATSTGTGTMADIKTKVMGVQISTGGPNNPVKLMAKLAFNSRPTYTAAT